MKEDLKIQGQLRYYLQWPIILSILLMAANLVVGLFDPKAGIAMAIFTVIYICFAIWLLIYRKKKLLSSLVEFSAEYAQVQKQLLYDMATPYAIAGDDGKLLWTNKEFALIIKDEKTSRKNLTSLFKAVNKEFLENLEENSSVHTSYDGKFYRLDVKQVCLDDWAGLKSGAPDNSNQEVLLAIYLFDETEILSYKTEIDNQKLVAGLVYLDNYDEALESVEEVRRSLLTALIDRKINKYISGMNGIVKKLEKDKYFFVIKQEYTDSIQEDRFALLEEVKTVNIGNEMAVTLSIGIGMNGDNYARNYEYARTAIDMALGRGGDQAVVKDGSKIRYYGGKSQQLEKTTRVKARVKAHAMRELMETKDKLLIMGHKIGDIDSFGAAVGIYRIATSFNKKARIVVNSVNSSVWPMMGRFQNNPDYPDDLLMTGEEAAEWADSNTMLVVVDVNRPSIAEAPELLKMIKTIVVFDHHRQSSEIIENAVLSYVEPYASSTCEMVAEILQYIGDDIKIKPAEADAMYAGIVIDTNNFMNQAGVRTFEAAAYLRRNGADVVRVRKLFRDKLEDYQAKAEAIRNAKIFETYFAISQCPSEGLDSPTVVGAQAANELLDIIGIKASFVLTELDGTIYFSARSIDEINVQVMMEKLGGGGHRTIAGAQIEGISIEEAIEKLKTLIMEMKEKGDL
ncbi:MAG: DHH family phosphoesterase [Clostridium sp.]